jgi:hypothetical protein
MKKQEEATDILDLVVSVLGESDFCEWIVEKCDQVFFEFSRAELIALFNDSPKLLSWNSFPPLLLLGSRYL